MWRPIIASDDHKIRLVQFGPELTAEGQRPDATKLQKFIMKPSIIKVRVRYPETDKMGVVHHSNYFIYFEMGRIEYLRSLGLPYAQLETEDIYLAVHEAKCKYKAPAHYDDLLVVETSLSRLTYAQVEFSYKLWREEAQPDSKTPNYSRGTLQHAPTPPLTLLAEGSTTLVCLDKDFKPRRIPDKIRNILPIEVES